MRTKHILCILVLLALALPASPAHAGGVVSVCDEAHLLAALAGGGTVTFTCSGTITLTNTITVAADTTIDGSGQTVTISGNQAGQAFNVNTEVTLTLNELTIAHGGTAQGGGIYNSGTLTVSNSTFSYNASEEGGGIYNRSTLTVSNSTFSGNSGMDLGGGGIYNAGGMVTVSNSTFYGNRGGSVSGRGASAGAGGIHNRSGTLVVSNSTFSGNIAGDGPSDISNGGGAVMLRNTIIANGQGGDNCSGRITDGGGNLSYPDATCPGINADPKLGPLQNNLGPTLTMALGPGSAAIDAAIDATCAADPVKGLDQRGIARPWGPHCDIGAVEQVPIKNLWLPTLLSR